MVETPHFQSPLESMEASPVKSTSSNKEPPSQNKSVESNESVEIPYTGDVLPRRGICSSMPELNANGT